MATQRTIPVNRDDVGDSFCRYKMPSLERVLRGSGNGKRTELTNVADVARCLGRDPKLLAQYVAYDLSTKLSTKAGTLQLAGWFGQADMQKVVYAFVDSFVLCPVCGCPETEFERMTTSKKKVKTGDCSLRLQCKACGSRKRGPDQEHKILKRVPIDLVSKKSK